MTPVELEKIYEALAEKIDDVPSDKRELFLAKLVLLLAQEISDESRVNELVIVAGANMET